MEIKRKLCYSFFNFLPDGGGGNYDIVNNAVISTPGPPNYRAQNVSLRQSWEMNYQEAAIYLQVNTSSRFWRLGVTRLYDVFFITRSTLYYP